MHKGQRFTCGDGCFSLASLVQKFKFDYEWGCFNCDWFAVLMYGEECKKLEC